MREIWNRISIGWCRMFHPEPSWPIHGQYHCPACLRLYLVPWEEGERFRRREGPTANAANRHPGSVALDF